MLVKIMLRDIIGVTGEGDCKNNVEGCRCEGQRDFKDNIEGHGCDK